ncbi:MAG: hypothetical protein D6739_12120 [Nitrospirae bacterium]|nr:MAG: hypothetical protein D6739_12120 [Nitrospirota bacterium]
MDEMLADLQGAFTGAGAGGRGVDRSAEWVPGGREVTYGLFVLRRRQVPGDLGTYPGTGSVAGTGPLFARLAGTGSHRAVTLKVPAAEDPAYGVTKVLGELGEDPLVPAPERPPRILDATACRRILTHLKGHDPAYLAHRARRHRDALFDPRLAARLPPLRTPQGRPSPPARRRAGTRREAPGPALALLQAYVDALEEVASAEDLVLVTVKVDGRMR